MKTKLEKPTALEAQLLAVLTPLGFRVSEHALLQAFINERTDYRRLTHQFLNLLSGLRAKGYLIRGTVIEDGKLESFNVYTVTRKGIIALNYYYSPDRPLFGFNMSPMPEWEQVRFERIKEYVG